MDSPAEPGGSRSLQSAPFPANELLELLGDGVLLHDWEGRIRFANERSCASLGYSAEELGQLSVGDIELGVDGEGVRGNWRRLVPGGPIATFQGQHRRKNGATFPVEVRVRAIEVAGERMFLVTSRDLSHEKRRDRTLRLFRRVFQESSDAIGVIDHEGTYLMQNAAHRELLGYEDGDLVGKTPALHLGEPGFRRISAALEAEGRYVGQHPSRRKGGEVIPIEVSAFMVQQDGQPPLFVGIKRDLRDAEREKSEALERERDLLLALRHAQKMESVGQLAAGIAHDFNNLLTPIVGYVELAMDGASDEQRVGLEQALKAARLAGELTQQMLAFGRRKVLEMRVLDLGEEVEQAARMLRRVIPESIETQVHVAEDTWRVRADATEIQQILMNLAVNARDAMPEGGSLTLSTRNEVVDRTHSIAHEVDPGPYAVISVVDNGCGMDPDVAQRVFEPFFTSKPRERGTGLGLATVYGIVKQHGGGVRLQTAPGKGTVFEIYLPGIQEPATELSAAPPVPTESSTGTVLLVEDEELVRSLVESVLARSGYSVRACSNPSEALEVAGAMETAIDLVLTDMVMPGGDGRSLVAAVSDMHPEARALYMSGYTDAELRGGDPLEPGSFLQKPFAPSELLTAVQARLMARR